MVHRNKSSLKLHRNPNKPCSLYGKCGKSNNISIKSIPPKKNQGYHGPRDKNSEEYKKYCENRFNEHFTRFNGPQQKQPRK